MDRDMDRTMTGFLFIKALIAVYGTERTADLLKLADRSVEAGLFSGRREAVWAIEKQMGLPLTQGG